MNQNINIKEYYNIPNRANAIRQAILKAEPNDVVLVAGKGHELQQIYKNKIFTISDECIIFGSIESILQTALTCDSN